MVTFEEAGIRGVVVDVYCYAAEGGDFGGQFGEARVILSVVREGGLVGGSLWYGLGVWGGCLEGGMGKGGMYLSRS